MGILSGIIKYKALKSAVGVVTNLVRGKKKKKDPAVTPYKTTATY